MLLFTASVPQFAMVHAVYYSNFALATVVIREAAWFLTDKGGYREPPELAEGENEGRSGTEGNHRKRGGEAPALKQRGAAWPHGHKPATKSLLQGAALERLSASNAMKQQTNKPPRRQTDPSRKATPKGPSDYRKQNTSVTSESGLLQSSGHVHNKAPRPSWPVGHTFNPQKRVARRNALPTLVLERIVKHS